VIWSIDLRQAEVHAREKWVPASYILSDARDKLAHVTTAWKIFDASREAIALDVRDEPT
jgi:hypothetical protein